MTVFTEDDAYNNKFPYTSDAKRRYKLTEEGRQQMTATLEKLIADETAEARNEGRIETLIKLVTDGLLTIAQAAAQIGESEQDFSKRLHA